MRTAILSTASLSGLLLLPSTLTAADDKPAAGPVSYYRQVRPILQAQCQGCHQPAKAKGGYVMTDFKKLLAGGENEGKAVIAGQPGKSALVKMITPEAGSTDAEMPKGKPPLPAHEIELIRNWITQGARDDTPADAVKHYDMEHPPLYSRPPVVTSIDYSPDGKLLAVAGYHEVLLHKADGSGIVGRLVGMSDRVQSVAFSPDGASLAVAGGQPGRVGEIQIWDVPRRKLALSVPITYDTVYGVSWSPDGQHVAFGCADNTVRAIEAKSGKEILKQGSHNDWVLTTVFSTNGSHVISAGRDMSTKLTELSTQRFVDNITSITPGQLRGGVHSIARHPDRDEILVGGADGVPQIYRVFRKTKRAIGDNAALLRRFPPMEGRIFSVDYSPDGKRIVAGSALNGTGQVHVFSAEFDSRLSTNLVKILEKTVGEQKPEEKAEIEKYVTSDVKLLATNTLQSAVYAVSFSPDGSRIAIAGGDGRVRLLNATNAAVVKEFAAAPGSRRRKEADAMVNVGGPPPYVGGYDAKEPLPATDQVVALDVQPAAVKFTSRNETLQLIVTAKLASGDAADVTRGASFKLSGKFAAVSANGLLTPLSNGKGKLEIAFAGKTAAVPVQIAGLKNSFDADFVRDVNPVLSKLGCNAGTCHGAKEGKNGFKLSLRGYDPEFDVRAFADDFAGRRVNLAAPDESLLLLKAIAEVPHEGSRRAERDSRYYHVMRQWIADGARLNAATPKVARIEVFPRNPVVQTIGSRQQLRVVASYADGLTRDVTADAFIESGNTDVARADDGGLVTSLRRGEAPVLARYDGAYAATTLTVMGDRAGFVWEQPETWNRIDEIVAAKWQRMKILPSGLSTDTEFLRRVTLDLTGLPPGADDVRRFLADSRDARAKRDELIDRLIGSPDFVDHWANKWADLLQVNRKFLGEEGAKLFRDWIRQEVEANTPYDQFARKILTASGSNKENPAASYYKILRTPAETMENTTHLFLATRFNCNKCHDHPFERWTMNQYYETAAFFAQVSLKKDPASGDKKIGGTAVEGSKPLYEIVSDATTGDVTHERTRRVTPPEFPFATKFDAADNAPRRERLAAWMTSADNRYFASSFANRIWGYLTGVGIIEPLDDIRAGNPPSNPELLEYLTAEFVKGGFDARRLMRLICKSRTYQLSFEANRWNEDDKINFSHALPRRLPAETLFDAVFKVTGSTPNFPGVKAGTRASQLPDAAVDVSSGLLANLGRPARESACECERSSDMRLSSVMAMLSGPTVSAAISDPKNAIADLVQRESDDRKLVDELFLRVFNRAPTEKELKAALATMGRLDGDHKGLTDALETKEREQVPIMAAKERQREANIADARKALADYEKEIEPRVKEEESKRLEKLVAAETALNESEAQLPARLEAWEAKLTETNFLATWTRLEPKELTATGGPKLEKLPDGSILASGPTGKDNQTDYTLTFSTPVTNITGVMIEVLPHESLTKFGPGRSKDGNFVLTELLLDWLPKKGAKAAKETRAEFNDARADFFQSKFDVKGAIDGKSDAGTENGWAIGKQGARPHHATFSLKEPILTTNGATLKLTLRQRFRDTLSIGRCRLYVTSSAKPLEFGLPTDVAAAVKTPAAARSAGETKTLLDHFRTVVDDEIHKMEQTHFTARQPLPTDPKVLEHRATVERVSRPVPLDSKLVQLRDDAKASAKQLENRRLTAAQDLAWALINNPAFLFNY